MDIGDTNLHNRFWVYAAMRQMPTHLSNTGEASAEFFLPSKPISLCICIAHPAVQSLCLFKRWGKKESHWFQRCTWAELATHVQSGNQGSHKDWFLPRMLLSVGEGSQSNTTLPFMKSFQNPMLSWKSFEKQTSHANMSVRGRRQQQLPLKNLT